MIIERGQIGEKDQDGKLRILWKISRGEVYYVCPFCGKIPHVPVELIDFSGINARADLRCPYCRKVSYVHFKDMKEEDLRKSGSPS